MTSTVQMPLWLLILILGFAAIAALDKVMLPSVRWFFRRRMERVVAKLNEKLERPIQPFKLARRHDMIQRLIYDPEVSKAIAHAIEEGVPENVAFEQARRYAREIVPSFSATAYFSIAIRLARFLSNSLYRVRVETIDLAALEAVDRDATVIFVMNHRSNMDYVLVTYLAAERSALSYAVGEWAQVWPLSRLIRAMGAYFIRRRARGALYRRVLARYVRLATDAGVMQAVFPEGGLSLDGAPAPPRMGILKYIVEGFDPTGRDVVFVPVALNYDRVFEDRILLAAGAAGERRFKARISVVPRFVLRQLWRRLRGHYRRFGYAAVSFGPPLSLAEYQGGQGAVLVDALALELMERIGAEVPLLPVPLVATALLRAGRPLDEAELCAMVETLVAEAGSSSDDLPLGSVAPTVRYGLELLTRRQLIAKSGDSHVILPGARDVVAYYASSIRHLLYESGDVAEDAATARL